MSHLLPRIVVFLRQSLVLSALLLCMTPALAEKGSEKPLVDVDFQNAITYIKSQSLTLKANQRTFEYKGSVSVTQEDMTLTCDQLTGSYDENNQIIELQALTNVVIVQGEGVRASANRAVYTRTTETIELTESPELQQNGSVLTADKITLFLKEDRSAAEGEVRVRLVENATRGTEIQGVVK